MGSVTRNSDGSQSARHTLSFHLVSYDQWLLFLSFDRQPVVSSSRELSGENRHANS